MGPGLQPVGAWFSNFLLGKVSLQFILHGMSIFHDIQMATYFGTAWRYSHMVGYSGSPTRTVYVDVTLTPSKVKVKVTGLLNFWKLPKTARFSVGGSWVPVWHNVAWAEPYLLTKWHLDPSSRLATINMDRKLAGMGVRCPFRGGGTNCILIHSTLHPHRTKRSDSIGRIVLQTVAIRHCFSGLWSTLQCHGTCVSWFQFSIYFTFRRFAHLAKFNICCLTKSYYTEVWRTALSCLP